MKLTAKKTKDGLLLQATEKRNGKTVAVPLKKLPPFLVGMIASTIKSHNEDKAHEQWLAKIVAELCRYYDKREEADEGESWGATGAVEFFIRDVFCGDSEAMHHVVIQCIDWLKGIHGIELTKDEARITDR